MTKPIGMVDVLVEGDRYVAEVSVVPDPTGLPGEQLIRIEIGFAATRGSDAGGVIVRFLADWIVSHPALIQPHPLVGKT